jgi:hypothetical protein
MTRSVYNASDVANANAPWTHWSVVRDYVNHAWDPENCPHHVLVGLTGSGKTYLGINGILGSMCTNDRVLILDTKQDDKLLMGTGKPVERLPRNTWDVPYSQKQAPRRWWYRLVVSDERVKGYGQLVSTLQRVYDEGNWIIYADEAYDLTGRESPYYGRGLSEIVQKIQRKGRSRSVSMISATQEPVGVARIFFSQASFAWMGRIRDEERQKRMLQIGGMTKNDLPILGSLRRRQWLLAADNGEYFARTIVV